MLPLYETLGVLLFYPALRSLAGRLPAVTVTAVLAFLPVLPGRDAAGGADGFFLTAAAILLLLSSRYVESLSMEPFTPKSWPVWAAFCGLLTGAAVFLDSAFFFPPDISHMGCPFLFFRRKERFRVDAGKRPVRSPEKGGGLLPDR